MILIQISTETMESEVVHRSDPHNDAHTPTHDASLNDALIPLRFKANTKELIA